MRFSRVKNEYTAIQPRWRVLAHPSAVSYKLDRNLKLVVRCTQGAPILESSSADIGAKQRPETNSSATFTQQKGALIR